MPEQGINLILVLENILLYEDDCIMKKDYQVPNIYLVLLIIIPLSWLINESLLCELGIVLFGYLFILLFNQLWLQEKNNRLYVKHQQVSKILNQVLSHK